MNKAFFLSLLLIFNVLSAETWYEKKLEGWYYFEDKEALSGEKKGLNPDEAEEILAEEKAKIHKLLSVALLDPTSENVENYLKQQKKWLDQSAKFASTWQQVLLSKPLLGDFLINPTSTFGILAKKEADLQQRKALLKQLSQTHFLLFFFRGKDPFSEKAAEVAQLFAEMNHWKVKAVSLDKEPIPVFPDAEVDQGISQSIGVQAAPAFYVIHPDKLRAIPVGAGLISVSELEENIEVQMKEVFDDN